MVRKDQNFIDLINSIKKMEYDLCLGLKNVLNQFPVEDLKKITTEQKQKNKFVFDFQFQFIYSFACFKIEMKESQIKTTFFTDFEKAKEEIKKTEK